MADTGSVVDLHRRDPPGRSHRPIGASYSDTGGKNKKTRREAPKNRRGLRACREERAGRIAAYSYRRASMGSRREARHAGSMPKKMPMEAEKPSPSAKDHHGSDTGNPEMTLTMRPIALPIR